MSITRTFSVGLSGHREPRLQRAVNRFRGRLSSLTGISLAEAEPRASGATLSIHCDRASAAVQAAREDESYTLEVTDSTARLDAATPLGVLHGLQTFLQLVQVGTQGFVVPAILIRDQPRFPWRGLLIDVGRHFEPVRVIERNLDGMEVVKLNVLHLHLSDYQGFRVESKVLPKLYQMGSEGQYYSQAELREMIAYGRDRGIRIVPEFDMPGHSTSWFVGYPKLASEPGPYSVEHKLGVFDPAMDPTRESTYAFLDAFIGEMAALFPDRYFHIGGDEVNGKAWEQNRQIQGFMKSHHLKGSADLQQYFNVRLQPIVRKHGKIMMGWDEVLNPRLPDDVVIQSWRGQESLADAARHRHPAVLSYGYYLDLMYPAARHYEVDPMADGAANLSPEEKQRILGGEACMWGEFVWSETIDSRVWPRAAAVAERLWSPPEVRDVLSMYQRLDAVSRELSWFGLQHRVTDEMLRRMAGVDDIAALRVLAEALEPVKEYDRAGPGGAEATTQDALNRLVDAVPPESEPARQFAEAVDALLAAKFRDPEKESYLRALLERWRGNDQKLEPLLGRSFLLQEAAPLSQDLASLGSAGLQALDYLVQGEGAPETWRQQQLAMIEQASRPKANLLIIVAPAVQRLVEAAASPQEGR